MDKIDSFMGYRQDQKKYCGRIDVKVMLLLALGLMLVTQLFITIWYLSYHVWYWFITLAFIIAANALLGFAFRTQNPQLVIPVIVYQALFVLLCIGASINLIVVLCHPYSNSYIFRQCAKDAQHTRDYCAKQVRIAGGVYFPIYLLFAFINIWCLTVLWCFYRSLRISTLSTYATRAAHPSTNQPNVSVGQIKTEQSQQQFQRPAGVPQQPYEPQEAQQPQFEPSSHRIEPDWGNVPVYVPETQTPVYVPESSSSHPGYYENTGEQPPAPGQPSSGSHLYDTTPNW